jgi:hypothetical protein
MRTNRYIAICPPLAGLALAGVLAATLATTSRTAVASAGFGPAAPVAELNSTAADGCPIESPDGRDFFLASTRPGTLGGNDIWAAHRANENQPWTTPEHLAAPLNSAANDFCPTPLPGKRLLFVSERPGADTCEAGPGSGDIYLTRLHPVHGPDVPQHLGCVADGTGPNFAGPEFSPSLVTTDAGIWLFFSSTGYDANMDLYVSEQQPDGSFGAPAKIVELSTAADDRMPNVSRDGLQMVFVSTRTDLPGAQGAHDIYLSQREHITDPWGTPINLGPEVNSALGESRPSLSADGDRLYFGRSGDIYLSTRTS